MTKTLTRLAGFAIALFALLAVGSGVRSDPHPTTPEEAIQRFGGSVSQYLEPDALAAPDDPCKPKARPADKTVTFVNSNLTDADLLCLSAALQALNPKKIDLRYTQVTGAGVWRHMYLPNLEDLDLSSTLANGGGLVDLIRFPNLRYLRLRYNRLLFDRLDEYLAVASAVPTAPHLRLHLGHVHMLQTVYFPDAPAPAVIDMPTDAWLDRLTAHANFLEGLDLSSTGVSKNGFTQALPKLPALVELNLSGNNELDDDALALLGEGQGSRITHLDLSGTCLTSKGLPRLKAYPNLRVLNLAKTRITDEGLPDLVRRNGGLTKLDLSGTVTCVTPASLIFIAHLPKLTTLNIAGTGIDDAGLKILWGEQTNRNDPDRPPSTPLEQYGALVSLDVSKTRVTNRGLVDDGPPPTAGFQLLRFIVCADTKITPGGVQYFQAVRANQPFIISGQRSPADVLRARFGTSR